ncbi:MAG TPA: hypothetical protein VIY72_08070, partial [Acidimicrobiales bacterium]
MSTPQSSDTVGLSARTRPLPLDPDLLAVAGDDGALFVHEGVGLAGVGVAARIRVPRLGGRSDADAVADALGAITVDDAVGLPGSGPVAMGALPFDPVAPGELVVPAVIVGRDEDGTRWVTTIAPGDAHPDDGAIDALLARGLTDTVGFAHDAGLVPDDGPTTYAVRAERTPQEWCAAVAEATHRLRAGDARKVVL